MNLGGGIRFSPQHSSPAGPSLSFPLCTHFLLFFSLSTDSLSVSLWVYLIHPFRSSLNRSEWNLLSSQHRSPVVLTQTCFAWLHDGSLPMGHLSSVCYNPHHFHAVALAPLAHPQVGLAPMGIPDGNPKLEPLSPKLCNKSSMHS